MVISLSQGALEAQTYAFDYSARLQLIAGQTIASVVGISSNPSGLTFGSTTTSGSQLLCRVSGGAEGTNYVVTALVTLSGGDSIACVGEELINSYPM